LYAALSHLSYICIHIYIYTYIFTEREREREMQRGRKMTLIVRGHAARISKVLHVAN